MKSADLPFLCETNLGDISEAVKKWSDYISVSHNQIKRVTQDTHITQRGVRVLLWGELVPHPMICTIFQNDKFFIVEDFKLELITQNKIHFALFQG